jgi:hypothetical protein
MSLFVVVGCMSPYNFQEGLRYGRVYHEKMEAFQLDLLAGEPVPKLVARHASSLCPCPFGGEPTWGIIAEKGQGARAGLKFPPVEDCVSFHDWLGDFLQALGRAGIGYFRLLQQSPAFRELPLEVAPTILHPAREGELISQGAPNGLNLTVVLQEPQFVYGIRVISERDFTQTDEVGPPVCRCSGKRVARVSSPSLNAISITGDRERAG